MSELSPLSTGQVSRAGRVGPAAGRRAEAAGTASATPLDRGPDQVQLSAHAERLLALKNGGPVREDLVNRIRSEIAQGTYETPEKLEAAIDEMLSDFDVD